MAESFNVPGPCAIKIGTTLAGYPDHDVGIVISEQHAGEPLSSDATGGTPEDFAQKGSLAFVSIVLSKWDRDQAAKLRGFVNAAGNEVSALGQSQGVGYQRVANRGSYDPLVIEPTRATASGGFQKFTFNRWCGNPNIDPEINQIKAAGAPRIVIPIIAFPDDNDLLYVTANVT